MHVVPQKPNQNTAFQKHGRAHSSHPWHFMDVKVPGGTRQRMLEQTPAQKKRRN